MKSYDKFKFGFTLVELMVTLAVIGIAALLALPQMGQMTQQNKMTQQINTLSRDIAYTRAEAITRGEPVQIVMNAGGWHMGWTVSVVSAPGTPLRQALAFNTINLTITETTGGGGTAGIITFRPDGSVDNTAALSLCDSTTNNVGKRLQLSAVGRVEIFNRTLRDGTTNVCP